MKVKALQRFFSDGEVLPPTSSYPLRDMYPKNINYIFTFKSTRDLFFMIIQQASGDDLYIF